MKPTKFWRRVIVAVVALLGSGLAAGPSHAVFLEADSIEADGAFSTVDLWFFAFDADVTATIKVNDLGGPPIIGADPDMIIYLDDGAFSNVFAIDTGIGTDPSINAFFAAGAYVSVVSNHELTVGEFGPTQPDIALAVGGYDYEFNGPEPVGGQIAINCVLSGNLNGGFTKRVIGQDTCVLPPTNTVVEPSALTLFAFGLMGFGFIKRRRTQAV
ncbi:MAG: hypothetical protein HOM25_09180 [Rhodospirillaceae bacterium]|nr:hypothetical protein [Rhodospirillaceae bacterium]MBT5666821.1 hypothetical protein [Rhodospirillaceae bacterium]